MFVKINSGALLGVKAVPVCIEVDIGAGHKYSIVGLPDSSVRESFQRIDVALKNSGFRMPRQRILVNMAPADFRKEGSSFDLAIACGVLAASNQMDAVQLSNYLVMGELSLDGGLKPFRGALLMAILAKQLHLKGVIGPLACAYQVLRAGETSVFALNTISDLPFLYRTTSAKPTYALTELPAKLTGEVVRRKSHLDLCEIKGQNGAKRALEIAAVGGHNLLMIGPPGSGKTLLASAFWGILPPLTNTQSLETNGIYSSLRRHLFEWSDEAPFRQPHQTITEVAMAGGGSSLRPGEVTLAHNGVLFLDELPEFKTSVLETLRVPIEAGYINLSRGGNEVRFPASFILVAAMNPCPCGYLGHRWKPCVCSAASLARYRNRVSGPLLDRVDMVIEVGALSPDELSSPVVGESSDAVLIRVKQAREFQNQNLADVGEIVLEIKSKTLLKAAAQKLSLSGRAYQRIVKVAGSIACLASSNVILPEHVAEAIQYRFHPAG